MTKTEVEFVLGRGHVQQVVLTKLSADNGLLLEVSLVEGPGQPLRLRFVGVTSLRLLGEAISLTQYVVLMARDIQGDQWDGLRFAVRDVEGEFVTFSCAMIEGLPRSVTV